MLALSPLYLWRTRVMRKQRALAVGLVAGGAVTGLVVVMVHVITTGGAGTALTIGLVGLGPAFAAIALVAALSAAAPPVKPAASSVLVAHTVAESPSEAQV
jgi:hypothetical protein